MHPRCYVFISQADSFAHTQHIHPHAVMVRQTQSHQAANYLGWEQLALAHDEA